MATSNKGMTGSETFGTTSPVSGSAPTLGTDGQPVQDMSTITVVADAGAVNLSGAGTLDGYVWDTEINKWARDKAADFTVNGTTPAQAFLYEVKCPRNMRRKWIPTGVTFASGANGVTVWQLGFGPMARGQFR